MNTTITTTPTTIPANMVASTPTTINTIPTTNMAAIGGKVLIVLSIIQIVAFHIYEMKKLSP